MSTVTENARGLGFRVASVNLVRRRGPFRAGEAAKGAVYVSNCRVDHQRRVVRSYSLRSSPSRALRPLHVGAVGRVQFLRDAGTPGSLSDESDRSRATRRAQHLRDLHWIDLLDALVRRPAGGSLPGSAQSGVHRRDSDGIRPVCPDATRTAESGSWPADRRQRVLQAEYLDHGRRALSPG